MGLLAVFVVLALAITIPLIFGVWPVGVLSAVVFTLISLGIIKWGNNRAEEGLGVMLSGFLLIIVAWVGVGIAGIVSVFT